MAAIVDLRASFLTSFAVCSPSEDDLLTALRRNMTTYSSRSEVISHRTRDLVTALRTNSDGPAVFEQILSQFSLSTEEGLALMGLAETLLRVPDANTAIEVVRSQLERGNWLRAVSMAQSTWPALAARALEWGQVLVGKPHNQSGGVLQRLSGPLVLRLAKQAMRYVGDQFIFSPDIQAAIRQAGSAPVRTLYSFDLLGEGARTFKDASEYQSELLSAIGRLGEEHANDDYLDGWQGPKELSRASISVKLSALDPRYEESQRALVVPRLAASLRKVFELAAAKGLAVTVDAEEQDRLEISLDVMASALSAPRLQSWAGAGLAVQAYGTRATQVIQWAAAVARARGVPLHVRLVKGAYWDTEIKRSQERGLNAYPVFTRKAATDTSFLAAAELLFQHAGALWPQFATHNAHTLCAVRELAAGKPYELQRLHGMGERLYARAAADHADFPFVRVYAPVGNHRTLLPYLVRRLLENGANNSFLSQQDDCSVPVSRLAGDPCELLDAGRGAVALPRELFGPARLAAQGMDLGKPQSWKVLADWYGRAVRHTKIFTGPCISGVWKVGDSVEVRSPANIAEVIGGYRAATALDARQALNEAHSSQASWAGKDVGARVDCLERAADELERRSADILPLLVREAGKCWPDAIAELREAVDFCRYYAVNARALAAPIELPGPTGETNVLRWHARGVFLCIAPWNFPLAIFIGQIAAALAMGNAVLAKPAPQTSLVAAAAIQILHDAGVPTAVLQFLPGDGVAVSEVVLGDSRLSGVAFTGSTMTAKKLNRMLAERDGPIVPFIAETGGINTMIVDSTALLEQVVDDVIASAFRSAGQRCSALRVLCLQEDIATEATKMLEGAMDELIIGDPANPETDVGPLIDMPALARVIAHLEALPPHAELLHEVKMRTRTDVGYFCAPRIVQLKDIRDLKSEVFGPVLHVVRFAASELPRLVSDIASLGYGLTMGIHTRLPRRAKGIAECSRVGNTYINRNIIGAVVGVQPFGGEGLSGTGPKAGGPHYLTRFAVERVITVNETAWGGNVALLRDATC